MFKFNTISDQVNELHVYFDDCNISYITNVEKLSLYEFLKIKQIIKICKDDDIYFVSHRVSLQLVFGEVIIINYKKNARRLD